MLLNEMIYSNFRVLDWIGTYLVYLGVSYRMCPLIIYRLLLRTTSMCGQLVEQFGEIKG